MRKKRELECDERRADRFEKQAQDRSDRAAAGDKALDAAVRQSIDFTVRDRRGCPGARHAG